MQLTEAATLHRKSGGAEGSAVPRIFPGNEEILCSNRIVISTGAQRSGEICGFFLGFSRRLFRRTLSPHRNPIQGQLSAQRALAASSKARTGTPNESHFRTSPVVWDRAASTIKSAC